MDYSQQRRFIPWIDFIIFGGLAVLSTIVAIIAIFILLSTSQHIGLGGWCTLSAMVIGFWAIALLVILGKWFDRPDYYTTWGTAVWLIRPDTPGDIIIPLLEDIDYAFDHILARLPELSNDPLITTPKLQELFRYASIEWIDKPLTVYSRCGWVMKDKSGLQKGTRIMVYFTGSIKQSAFYHEMGHMIRQYLLHKPGDTNHEDKAWWAIIRQLQLEHDALDGMEIK